MERYFTTRITIYTVQSLLSLGTPVMMPAVARFHRRGVD